MLVLSKTTLMKGSPLDARSSGEPSPEAPGEVAPEGSDWHGTARYDVRARIGTGGMGAVYEAFDRQRGQLVAVKTLLRFSPSALYRFKQEFRTLADVVHPNLVHLYELVATDADVFFAMELVRGVDFLAHVLRPGAPVRATAQPTARLTGAGRDADRTGPIDAPLPPRPPPTLRSPSDYARLRPALRQLVAGVSALHAAGKLHRDIKPSNVLVTPEGRVVLLDFGVATDVSRVFLANREDREVVGTARYMAPEQAGESAPSPASDWYSVGAMLYEALVGSAPFTGSSFEVLARKTLVEAPAPSESVLDVPNDLDTLCCALLRRDPGGRPSDEEIVRWLGERPPTARRPPPPMGALPRGVAGGEPPLVGRRVEQQALLDAFEASRAGRRLVAVRVHGASGMGKSALVQHFIDGLLARGEAAILQGRAYERESMPYKALDSVVDGLSRHLMRLSERLPSMPLPRDIGALAQLFPVLGRIQRVNDVAVVAGGPSAVRRRAVGALRHLLGQIAAGKALVVSIDDLQWGDVDSAGLLLELVGLPFEVPLLLVMANRDGDGDSSPFVIEMRTRWPLRAEARDIALGPLGLGEARALARGFLAGDGVPREEDAAAEETADSIARESGGNPLLVEELARSFARPRRTAWALAPIPPPGAVRLESVVQARMEALRPDARRLLELVAVSARPLPVTIVGDAAGVYEQLEDTIASLRSRRFVRTGFRDGREVVEMLHDRVRQTIVAQLSEETLREHHGRLARVLEPVPGVDTEALAVHLLGAGEKARAAKYAERAAEQAAAKVAFGQAVRLYKLEIEMLGEGSPELRRVRVRLAEVLERAALGVEAAEVYLAAASRARGLERMELERGAAAQLLLSGHLSEGEAALGRILAAAGMRQPRTMIGALLWLVFYRAALAVFGTEPRELESRDVRRVDHLRIEALHAVIIGLSFVNVVYANFLQPRHLFLALRAGDRFQVLRAAGFEALHAAARGGPVGARERKFAQIVERMAERIGDVDSRAFHLGTRGIRMFLHGQWREASEVLVDAIDRYAATPAGWHSNAQLFVVYALMFRGHLAELRTHHAARLADAEERGDLYTTVNMRIGHSNGVWLVSDDVAAARRHVREAMAAWPERGFSVQRYRALLAEVNLDLYAGEGAAAYARVRRHWGALRRSLLMSVQYIRADAYFMRARGALAVGRPREAERFARKLDAERMPWTSALAALVHALVALAQGDRRGGAARLRAAIDRAEAVDMNLHAAVARLRLGALREGGAREGGAREGGAREGGAWDEDAAARARVWMIEQGVVRADRIAAMLLPGME
jgi:serine/threonine protein kinase